MLLISTRSRSLVAAVVLYTTLLIPVARAESIGHPRGHAGLTKAKPRTTPLDSRMLDVADEMEDLGEHLDEFGYVTVSTPLLSRPDGRFTFGLDRSADEYFDEAKREIQGEAASFEQRTFTLAVEAAMQMSPEAKQDAAETRERCRRLRAQADERMEARRIAVEAQYTAERLKALDEEDASKRAEIEAAAAQRRADGLKNAVEVDPCPAAEPGKVPDPPGARQPVDHDGDGKPDAGPPEFAGTGEFSPFGELIKGGPSPTLSNRAAIIQAAGDRAVQAIFNVLGDPGAAQRFADRITLLGVSTVTVAPGWRTRMGFAADVAVAVELSYTKARPEIAEEVIKSLCNQPELAGALARNHGLSKDELTALRGHCEDAVKQARLAEADAEARRVEITEEAWTRNVNDATERAARENASGRSRTLGAFERPSIPWASLSVPARYNPPQALDRDHVPLDRPVPVVTSVSPMTESQNLDLASSLRSRKSMALGLNFILRSAGMNQSADAFASYVKQMEVDVATRTPDVLVSSFGGSHLFGYQVGPQLKAIGDAASRKPKPRMELGRQTFPALVICGFSREDLRPVIGLEPLTGTPPSRNSAPAGPEPEPPVRERNAPNDLDSFDGARAYVFEPQLRFTQVPRWVPLDKKSSRDAVEEDDLMEIAADLDDAQPPQSDARTSAVSREPADRRRHAASDGIFDRAASLADMRIEEMWARAFGSTAALTLPLELIHDPEAATTPKVEFIRPSSVALSKTGAKFSVTAIGSGLQYLSSVLDVNGIVKANLLRGPDPSSQVVEIEVVKQGTALLQFYGTSKDATADDPVRPVAALTLDIRQPKEPPEKPAPAVEVASIKLQRDDKQALQGVSVQVQKDLADEALAEALKLLGITITGKLPQE